MLTSIDLDNLVTIFYAQISIAVLIFFIIFRGLFSRIIIKLYYTLIKSKKSPKDSSMYKPLNTFFILFGIFLTMNILPVSKQFLYVVTKLFKIILTFYITRAIATLIVEDSILFKKVFKRSSNSAVDKLICKIIRVILWIIFIFISLTEMGYNLNGLGGLATGLGIGSAAIALAAQDFVKSLISGFTILTDKPFVIGDWIEVGDFAGSVIDITFRSVRIKSFNNAVITIPNSTITSTYVINWNRLTSRRFDTILNISLDTPADKIRKIVKEIKVVLMNNPDVIKETVQVSVDAISSYSTDIKIFLYVRQADYLKFLKVKEDILCSLLFLAEKENINLAYPSQTVFIKGKDEEEA